MKGFVPFLVGGGAMSQVFRVERTKIKYLSYQRA